MAPLVLYCLWVCLCRHKNINKAEMKWWHILGWFIIIYFLSTNMLYLVKCSIANLSQTIATFVTIHWYSYDPGYVPLHPTPKPPSTYLNHGGFIPTVFCYPFELSAAVCCSAHPPSIRAEELVGLNRTKVQ